MLDLPVIGLYPGHRLDRPIRNLKAQLAFLNEVYQLHCFQNSALNYSRLSTATRYRIDKTISSSFRMPGASRSLDLYSIAG